MLGELFPLKSSFCCGLPRKKRATLDYQDYSVLAPYNYAVQHISFIDNVHLRINHLVVWESQSQNKKRWHTFCLFLRLKNL